MAEIITDMDTLTEADFGPVDWEDTVTASKVDPVAPITRETLRPKFDSVAAFKLWTWSLDSGQDADHGNAVDWHRWSALFRNVTGSDSPHKSEQPAAMLHTTSQGFVSAEWYGDGNAAEADWEALEKEWDDFDGQDGEDGETDA